MSSQEKSTKAGLWALCVKIGTKLFSVLIKLIKSLKAVKVGLAAVSLVGYSVIYNWKFAILIMIAIGFHEASHVRAAKFLSLKTRGWAYLPFLGGVAVIDEDYKSYGQNAFVALAGPLGGALLAWLTSILYFTTGNPMWAAAAAFQAMINLFNLLPVNPLDGGQIMRTIAFSIHKNLGLVFLFLSIVLGVIVMWKFHIGLFALLLAVSLFELIMEVHYRRKLRLAQLGLMNKWNLPDHMLDDSQENGLKLYPKSMNYKQLLLAFVSYVGTVAMLVALLTLLKNVPGADLAANFLD